MSTARPVTAHRLVVLALGLGLGLTGSHCADPPPAPVAKTELVIVTRNAATSYYEDRHGQWVGFEHDLASAFARHLNLKARFVVVGSVEELLRAVAEGQADVAAAGITRTASRAQRFITGPAYHTVEESLVCHPEAGVEEPTDLVAKRVRVVAGSSYVESLERLKEKVPGLAWTTSLEESTQQLLLQVGEGRLDCTVADSNILALDRRHLPELRTPFALSGERSLVWLFSQPSAHLAGAAESWFPEIKQTGRLQALKDRYYGHVTKFDFHDTSVFRQRVAERLPAYKPLFVAASEQSGLPWTLLAALAYQESHWNPQATSPTGVRGMMMLTQHTARSLGVTDRLDAQQSISGGARYLAGLVERIPAFVPEPDRLWMALAAYNVGLGHLQDARVLAVEKSRNPNSWPGVKSCLPLLSRKQYYLRLRHGYARGHEPVFFVEHVRNYFDLLTLPPGSTQTD